MIKIKAVIREYIHIYSLNAYRHSKLNIKEREKEIIITINIRYIYVNTVLIKIKIKTVKEILIFKY